MTIASDIVELGASFFRRGLTFGGTGNLSAVDADGTILMTPTGVSLERLHAGSLSRVAPDGQHIGGPSPTKEAFLHLAIYRARPDARAVVHTHSTHSVAVSCLRDVETSNALPVLTAYYAMRVGELPLMPSRRSRKRPICTCCCGDTPCAR
jgi:3-dehydro-4-phosphotetronate decarboxylase